LQYGKNVKTVKEYFFKFFCFKDILHNIMQQLTRNKVTCETVP